MLSPDSAPDAFLFRILLILLVNAFPSSDILQGNFKPDFYLKYIQKDLRLAIALGDAVNHPTPMAAAANEVTAGGCGCGLQTSLVPLHCPFCRLCLGLAVSDLSRGSLRLLILGFPFLKLYVSSNPC